MNEGSKWSKYCNQTAATLVVSLGFLATGYVRAWASPAMPSLQTDEDYKLSYAPLSKEAASWICKMKLN